ncbi:bi-functional transferase/deacetylase, partial [Streptomyces sp. NEAU-H3]|nr:bi-functional transferase/deacetylase [Streptomyces sp. NEAU-H3]
MANRSRPPRPRTGSIRSGARSGARPRTGSGARSRPAARRRRRRGLPLRYLLPVLFLCAVVAMLMLRGYVHSEIMADHRVRPEAATDKVPEKILDGGPVIDTRDGKEKSLRIPDHRIVLTFDDGPD